jgi:hypothetical protein
MWETKFHTHVQNNWQSYGLINKLISTKKTNFYLTNKRCNAAQLNLLLQSDNATKPAIYILSYKNHINATSQSV